MNLYRCTGCGTLVAVAGKPETCPSDNHKVSDGSYRGNRMERIRDPADFFE